ncbi:hypothetical protein [Mucilaginibacter paludis]|uniref:Uncharacterized protein n=1 Tax=Mucilaginibacter paludis DSM 18603 TaxID=714943 RepID=H1Y1J3_9SPHI|nr:hypothetical protein [Mucilaginibacter paludis]EHQ30867.1 hypothetical protein Mucpa_6818 [Mucilaginibacter paludis DSM 18603]
MAKALIKLAYKQVIDSSASSDFERSVFSTSYQEFLMKSQAYNMDRIFRSFDDIKAHDGRANSLHYKLSIAVTHLIDKLDYKIPGLKDHLGNDVAFEIPEFKLLSSDILDSSAHRISINYITGIFTLFKAMNEYLLLAPGDQSKKNEPVETFLISIQPNLSIFQYQEVL